MRLSGEGVAQERLTCDAVWGGAVRCHECLRLAGGEGVAHGRAGQLHLDPGTEGAELQRHGHGQAARVQAPAEFRGEAVSEGESAFDPGLLAAEKFGDGCRGQPIFVME